MFMRSAEKCEDLESGNRQMSHRQYSGMTYRPTAHGLSVQGLSPDSPSFVLLRSAKAAATKAGLCKASNSPRPRRPQSFAHHQRGHSEGGRRVQRVCRRLQYGQVMPLPVPAPSTYRAFATPTRLRNATGPRLHALGDVWEEQAEHGNTVYR